MNQTPTIPAERIPRSSVWLSALAKLMMVWTLLTYQPALGQTVIEAVPTSDSIRTIGIRSPFDTGLVPILNRPMGHLGAASCAASNCHGGPRPSVASPEANRGSEYPLWMELDPHARSWATLTSDQSTRILSKLNILRDGKILNRAAYENCLACHNTTQTVDIDPIIPSLAEGVGCEACHGPAQNWLATHFVSATPLAAGMTDTLSAIRRAKLCVTCHVGSSDRDMNHDIIAAGHPALYFDMAVYHERYPKHWRDTVESSKDRRAQWWLAGQIAMTDAELGLLEARATQATSVSVWPELSVYACTDCHQSLQGVPRTATAVDRERINQGRAGYRQWNFEGVDALAAYVGSPEPGLSRQLTELKELLQHRSNQPQRVAEVARQLRSDLAAQTLALADLDLRPWTMDQQRRLSQYRLTNPAIESDWESAAKMYISVWAGQARSDSQLLVDAMRTLRSGLIFRTETQSPRFPRSPNMPQPPNFEEWRNALRQAAIGLTEFSAP